MPPTVEDQLQQKLAALSKVNELVRKALIVLEKITLYTFQASWLSNLQWRTVTIAGHDYSAHLTEGQAYVFTTAASAASALGMVTDEISRIRVEASFAGDAFVHPRPSGFVVRTATISDEDTPTAQKLTHTARVASGDGRIIPPGSGRCYDPNNPSNCHGESSAAACSSDYPGFTFDSGLACPKGGLDTVLTESLPHASALSKGNSDKEERSKQ